MDTQTQIDRLIELAIIQRTELKQLVEQLPQLREHLNAEVEKVFDETEPQLRAELEEWTTKQTADKTAALGVALEAKIADLAKSLEVSTQARYNAIIAERAENARLAAQAEAKIAEHAASLPSAVKEIVSAELARFPRAGEIDQLRKEFAEPRGLNPRGKWQAGETYNKLDLVTINGDSYTSNTDGNRTRPSRSSADWTLVAARGTGGGGGPTSLSELTTVPSDGDVLIGSGTSWVTSNLTAGAGISITVGPGAITISATDGDITLDDGTAASPSLHFTNDPDTGIYRPAANTLGISTSGVQRMYVDENGITTVGAGGTFDGSVHAANGNANNPSFSFTSDEDTGFFRHAANEIGIALGGTQYATLTSTTFSITPVVTMASSLRVNGTTDSSSKDTGAIVTEGGLGVEKSASIGGSLTVTQNVSANGTGPHTFSNGRIESPHLRTTGFGLGTGVTLWRDTTPTKAGALYLSTAGEVVLAQYNGTAWAEPFFITTTGNTTLAGNLTVSGAGTSSIGGNTKIGNPANANQRLVVDGAVAGVGAITTNTGLSGGYLYSDGGTGGVVAAWNGGNYSALSILGNTVTIGTGASGTTAATISSGGNLGIGTTSPTRPLDVRGSLGMQVNEDNSGTKVISIRSDFASAGPAINVTTNDPLLFLTNNSERARITSGGNYLIGTTIDGGYKLRVNGSIASDDVITMLKSGGNSTNVDGNFGQVIARTSTGNIGFACALANNGDYGGFTIATPSQSRSVAFLGSNGIAYIQTNNGTTALTLDSSQNATFAGSAGIGGAPSGTYGKLSVHGGLRTVNDTNSKLEIGRYSSGTQNSYIKIGSSSSSLRVTNAADSVDLLTLTDGASGGNLGLNTPDQFGSGVGVFSIKNAVTVPSTNPTACGILYVEAGALKYRGSSGTVTTIANA